MKHMTDEQENPEVENEEKTLISAGFSKAMAILFVLAIYFVIFLKILFIE